MNGCPELKLVGGGGGAPIKAQHKGDLCGDGMVLRADGGDGYANPHVIELCTPLCQHQFPGFDIAYSYVRVNLSWKFRERHARASLYYLCNFL